MFKSLMSTRRFAPIFWCQFLSAFNDNFLRNALVFLILARVAGDEQQILIQLGAAIFMLPSFLLSALGGELADRFDKAVVARRLKLAEIPVALLAVFGLWAISLVILFLALFGFGVISALFGPLKYGILPDHLTLAELPSGNALVEMATFIAILLGTIAGGIAMYGGGHLPGFATLIVSFAALSWASSLMIPKTGEAAPNLTIDRNILRSTFRLLAELRRSPRLWTNGIVVSWFWLVGIVMLSALPSLIQGYFHGSESVTTAMIAAFAIGIALGSSLAAWLASGRIVLLPTPVAAVFMALFGIDLAYLAWSAVPSMEVLDWKAFFSTATGLRVGFDFTGLAAAGGLYVVPAFSAIQAWAGPEQRARVIAAVNVLGAAFMASGALAALALQAMGLGLPFLLGALALGNAIAAVLIFCVMRASALQDFLSILFRAFYRLEVSGAENLKRGGQNPIIALNHVSFLDAALAMSLLETKPIFAIDYQIAQSWWVRPFLRLVRAMPLDPTKPMATRTLINAVKSGDPLVIFPEGRLTVTGALMKVYDGAGLIADKSDSLVIPVKIDGLEQTPFSRLTERQVRRRWWPKVKVTVLEPVKLAVDQNLRGKARRETAGTALYQIMSDMVFRTAQRDCTLFEAVVEAAERHGPRRIVLESPIGKPLNYNALLTGAAALGRKFLPLAEEGGAVGVLLPNAPATVASLIGLMSAGRVPAMLNFTAGAANILSGCSAARVTTVVTSRAFIEKGKLGGLVAALSEKVRVIYLEDVAKEISLIDKARAFMLRRRSIVRRSPDDMTAILFTSGSEGVPKGVALSSRNIMANLAQAEARIDFGRSDKVFNVLPLFHSFGLTIGTLLPLVSGVPIFLYPSPLHYRIVPEMVYSCNATLLFGTDTFLSGYARTAHAYDFRSLRYVLAGAEPVKPSTRMTYLEKFGLRIFEGYGVTETAPVLALNTPMYNRFGTVGRLMPGIEARIEQLPGIEEGGRLWVKGPNIMLGYLRADASGVLQPPENGWYDTGDIVAIDTEGFLTIKGRAKRFAKVGGEMVSLAAIEALAADLWPGVLSAAAALPDAKKGERVILTTQQKNATRGDYQVFARARGVAEVMMPSDVVVVDAIPVLGSGKLDFAGVTKMVQERFAT